MTEQRAERDVTMPALLMLMLCCSMASWMDTLEGEREREGEGEARGGR